MEKTFANRLMSLRQEKELSQDALAKSLGTSRSAIGMYEQGRREPDLEAIRRIADFFGVSSDYLLGMTNARKEPARSYDNDLADLGNRLSPKEFALLTAFRSADAETQIDILRRLGIR